MCGSDRQWKYTLRIMIYVTKVIIGYKSYCTRVIIEDYIMCNVKVMSNLIDPTSRLTDVGIRLVFNALSSCFKCLAT